MIRLHRRDLLKSAAGLALLAGAAKAGVLHGALPWAPNAGAPPHPVDPQGWLFFTPAEAAAVEAIADRFIPPDPDTPGGKDTGCAVYVDRQLAGPYGRREGLYVRPPFLKGTKTQGPQNAEGPAARYRTALADLDKLSGAAHAGKFADLTAEQQDDILTKLESGALTQGAADKGFFETILQDVKQGFFADPLYGGNRDMASWRMIGYPGARYNYRDWVERHNERFPLPPVSIMGRSDWTSQSG